MRPLRLEVEGFTAFRTRQILDLREFGLFVITGPTGSGKSSLLDAMIYALYGQVPRVGNEARQFITQGAQRLTVSLEFSAGERVCRVARLVPRSGQAKFVLEEQREDGWQTVADRAREVNARIEDLIGLDYDAFTRAVVLPQGEFAEFLSGDTAKRREVLEHLLALNLYSGMGERARMRAKGLRDEILRTETLIQSTLADATEDAVRALREKAREAGHRVRQVGAVLQRLEGLEARWRRYGDLSQEMKRLAQTCRTVRGTLDTITARVRTLEPELAAASAEVTTCRQELQRCQEAERAAREALGKQEAQWGMLTRIAAAVEQAATLQDAVSAAVTLEARLAAYRQEERKQAGALAQKDDARRQAHEAAVAAEELVGAAREDRDRTAAMIAALRNASTLLDGMAREAAGRARRLAALEKEVAGARAKVKQAEEETAAAEEAHRRHTIQAAAATVRRGWKPGDPCPVCGQPVVVLPETGEADVHELKTLEQAAGAARARLEDAKVRLREMEVSHRELTAADAQETQRKEEVLALLRPSFPDITPEAVQPALAECRKKLEESQARLKDAEGTLRAGRDAALGAATEFQKARGDLETAQRLAAEAEKDLKARSTEIQRLEKALADLFPSIPGDVQKVLAERQARLQALVDAAESARTKTGEAVARATRAEEVLRRLDAARAGAAQEASAAWEPARSVVQEARQRASGLLSLSLPAVPRGALPAELAALREALDQRMAWLDQAAARLDEAQNACQAEQSEALAAARSEVSAVAGGSVSGGMDEILAKARELQTGVVTEQATIATRLEEAQKRLEERRRLEQGIEQSRKKAAALEEVGRELQANRFPAYLQTQTLTTLAATASRRLLELSQGRYRLVARGEDFLVADAWNADEERSVKTLSGGESFLASLALALALSERMVFLASGGARLDSLFLDEGFGTLDSESLDVVISAIETLQGDGRMVGIITHVPEVAERLPARIEVVKSSHGSTLRVAS